VQRMDRESVRADLRGRVADIYGKRPQEFEGFDFAEVEKIVLLQMIDKAWKGHLYDLDHLKKSIGLRAYGQKDPKVEYQKESYILFEAMMGRIREQAVEYLFKVQAPRVSTAPKATIESGAVETEDRMTPASTPQPAEPPKPAPRKSVLERGPSVVPTELAHIGRNDPCYCGSGKKFKKCHGS